MTDTASGSTTGPSGDSIDRASAEAARRRRRARSLVEWMVVLAVALLLAIGVRTYLAATFWIPSGSMEPTLEIGDRVIVDKTDASLADLDRGDIVVFERPAGSVSTDGVDDLIKRIVAFPGETVEGRDGQVWVDGEPLDEPWLPDGVSTSSFPPTTLAEGTFWAMGDNRSNSGDSRVFGPVPADLLVGQAVLRIWPLDRAGGL